MEYDSNGTTKNNLLPSIPVFVDRVWEIEQIERLFRDPGVNVITVSGPAGIGKTAFATEAARRQMEAERFPGGVVWLNCAVLNTLPNILTRIAEVVGLDSASIGSGRLREEILRHLRSASTLLVFDDYDAVAEDDSILSFIGHLPRSTKVLILTRKSVRVPGREISLRLTPFDESAAMELWRQYLKSKGLAETGVETFRDIYRQTGGHPLTLRLVASLVEQGQSPLEVLRRFEDSTIPEEIAGRLVLDQVYESLSRKQIRFLEALSTFAHPTDGTTIASVAEMQSWQGSADALVRKAVIDFIDGRYALHPLTRAYLQNRIGREELVTLQQRMVRHYLAYVEKYQYDFDRIDREWPNIQYAFETAYHNELWQSFIEFILRLGQFLTTRGYGEEYQNWLRQALDSSEKIGDPSTKAVLLHNLAVQYQERGDLDGAVELYKQSLALKEATGDLAAESATLTNIGSVYLSRGDIRSAIAYYEQALAISRRIGDRLGEANILGSLGVSHIDLGDYRQATAYYEEALAISKTLGDHRGEANALSNLGTAFAALGDSRRAIPYYEQALTISREIGDRRAEYMGLRNLGTAYQDQYARTGSPDNLDIAVHFFEQSLDISREMGDRRTEANLYANLGTAYRDQYMGTGSADNLDIAIHFFQQALDISREIGDRRTEANLYANLGTAYRDRYARTGSADNLDIAIHFFQQSLDISREIGDQRTEANLYANLGTAYRDQYIRTGSADSLDTAIHFLNRSLDFFEVDIYPVEYATIQNNLANAYALLERGDKAENIERAIGHYREALRVHPPDSPLVASSLHNLGIALSERAQILGAYEEYAQAIEVLQQALDQTPPRSPDWLRVASNLIKAYVEVGNWLEAKSLSSAVLSRAGTDPSDLEALLPWYQGLGDLAIHNQDLEFATRVFAEAIRRFEIQGKKVPDALSGKLVELRQQLGDDGFVLIWAEAQGVLTPVLAQKIHDARQLMSQEQFGEAVNRLSDALLLLSEMELTKECKRQRATILFLRGFCLRKQGLWGEALQDQEQSFPLFEELRDYVGEAHTFLEMGHLLEVMNNYEDARLHYIDAYRLYRRAENKRGMALASENLGRLEYRVRMFLQAVQDLEEARRLYISIGDRLRATTIDVDLESARASLDYQATNNKQGESE